MGNKDTTKSLKFRNMKQSKCISKRLFIFMIMIIISSLAAGCKSCKEGEKEGEKGEEKENKDENDDGIVITDAMLASVEAAINGSGGPAYNFLLGVLKNLKEKKSVDVNATTDIAGRTALIFAVDVGNADIVKVLIKKGADVNKASNSGSRPLTEAASSGNTQVVQALLDAPGIDINATSGGVGRTALYIAAEKAHKDIVLLLLNKSDIKLNEVYNHNGVLRTARSIAKYSRGLNSTTPKEFVVYNEIIAKLKEKGGKL
jgi:ankyrin repeat protein